MNCNVIINEMHYSVNNRLRAISDTDYKNISKLTIGGLPFIYFDEKYLKLFMRIKSLV
jgi:hypothetical protein